MLDHPLLSLELPTKPAEHRTFGGLKGATLALGLLEAARKHSGLVVAITATTSAATQLESELEFFTHEDDSIKVFSIPDWETLPYDSFSPHQDIISQRLATLLTVPNINKGILVVPSATLMHRFCPKEWLFGQSLNLKVGQKFEIHGMRSQLEACGYYCVETVREHGQFAVRGSIIDVFMMGTDVPCRIELFDDEIETLRTFDPETQRSIEKIESIELLPAKEFPLDPAAIKRFKENWRDNFDVDYRQCSVYQDISQGLASAGIEYYLPLFFDRVGDLFEYLPRSALIAVTGSLNTAIGAFWNECNDRYEDRRYDRTRPILPPNKLFLTEEECFRQLKQFPRINFTSEILEIHAGISNTPALEPPSLAIQARSETPYAALQQHVAFCTSHKTRILFCAESAGRRETLQELLAKADIRPQQKRNWLDFITDSSCEIAITIGPLEQGLWLSDPAICIISEPQLFGQRVMQSRRRRKSDINAENVIKNLTELRIGAPVVHLDHGVGRYLGLQTLTVENEKQEFLTLEYADKAKLYVPVAALHLISRYGGVDDDNAPLHRLGTDQWQKEKRKAAEQIFDVAAELLSTYARRAAKPGHAFSWDEQDYEIFADGFPFEETPDQQVAIDAVIDDLQAAKPMDRLVCGDVGFGKTEVAMRAAFVVIQSGKQVAVLVPTTLLAQQHYNTFKDRFADWPVTIEVLSRFKSAKEQTEALKKIEAGGIDIVIGTHKLIQESVKFKDLGLMIVDEEHRFGVRDKEKLKTIRADVDILTLTATPIPRTLNLAFASLRDMSIIATPPAKRLSIKTFVRESNPALVKEAILRELLRGGQVYYLHNEVKSIEKCADELRSLIPEARIAIAHGQLRERELEQVMSDFYHRRFNVLVCSTIIETGIDVPSANTIIIDRADKLGLAQLHQIRGRVGRSHHQAYAYLLTPNPKSMTGDAVKRLEAIERADDLGAGFTLASYDLEIRGAGELLGEEQSGNMHSIGFSLYMEMLERAVKAIQKGKTPNLDKPLDHGAEINLRIPALIPDDYLPDVHNRLIMYKRISNAGSNEELDELQVEMIDRFGLLPDSAKNLFRITSLKLRAQQLGIVKIDAGPQGGRIDFDTTTQIDPLTLIKLIQTQPNRYKLDGADRVKFFMPMPDTISRLETIEKLLDMLALPPTKDAYAANTSSKNKAENAISQAKVTIKGRKK